MNKDLKQNLYAAVSPYKGYVTSAAFNIGSGVFSLTESGSGSGFSDVNRIDVPSIRPYGVISVPVANTQQVLGNLGVGTNNPVVIGHLVVRSGWPAGFGLSSGETAIYSTNLATKVGNTAVEYYYNGTKATAISGEDINQILETLIPYVNTTIQQYLMLIHETFNAHVHGTSDGPTPTLDPSPAVSNQLTLDLLSVQEGKTLITSTGKTPLPTSGPIPVPPVEN